MTALLRWRWNLCVCSRQKSLVADEFWRLLTFTRIIKTSVMVDYYVSDMNILILMESTIWRDKQPVAEKAW